MELDDGGGGGGGSGNLCTVEWTELEECLEAVGQSRVVVLLLVVLLLVVLLLGQRLKLYLNHTP